MSTQTSAPQPKTRWSLRSSLLLKQTAFVAMLTIVTGGTLILASESFGRRIVRDEIDQRLALAAADRQALLQTYIHQQQGLAALVASRTRLRQLVADRAAGKIAKDEFRQQSAQILADAQRSAEGFLSISIADPRGTIITATDEAYVGKAYSTDPDFLEGRRKGNLGAPRRVEGRYQSLLTAPVVGNDGQLQAVVIVVLDVQPLADLLTGRAGLGESGEILVGTQRNSTIHLLLPARHNPQLTDISLGNMPAMVPAVRGQMGVIHARDYRGVEVLAAYRPVGYRDWGLVVKMDAAEAYAPLAGFRTLVIILELGIFLTGLALAYLLSMRFTKPILELAQEDLRESEQRFRLMFASNPLPMWVYDLQTLQFLEVNEAAITHYGYSRSEFLQMRITDIRPAEDVPRLLDDVAKDRSPLQSSRDWRHRRKTGELMDVQITSHKFALDGREVVLVVSTDVTDQKRSEAARRASDARKTAMLDTALDAIITIDHAGRIVEFNPAAERIFGYARDHAMGREMAGLIIPPRLRDQHYKGFAHYLATQEGPVLGKRIEMSALRADGTEFPVELAISPIVIDGPPMFTAYVRDISDRRRIEEERLSALRREQAARAEAEAMQQRSTFLADASKLLAATLEYRTTLANVARAAVPHVADWCAVDIIDTDQSLQRLAVAHADPAKMEMAYELQRRYPTDPREPGPIHDVLSTGKPVLATEIPEALLERAARDEDHLHLIRQLGLTSYILTPITIGSRVVGLISLVSAESGRRFASEDLAMAEELARRAAMAIENAMHYREAQVLNLELEHRVADRTAELEAANKELEAFSYSVAHDLRAPLRAMHGFSRLVVEDFAPHLPDEAQRYLHLVQDNAEQMGRLIDDLLTFSRLGRKVLDKQRVHTAELVRQVVSDLQQEKTGREVTIQIGDLPDCTADPALLKQVFANLLSNALKFTRTRHPASIEVASRVDGGEPVYQVKDNGVGFDMQYAGKLFGVFQRLHRAEEYEGTGVGLAIVQRIVHRHGGRTWAESVLDKGATFYFTLGGASDDGGAGRNSAG